MYIQTHRQTDRQTDKQTDKHTYVDAHTVAICSKQFIIVRAFIHVFPAMGCRRRGTDHGWFVAEEEDSALRFKVLGIGP